LLCTSAAVAAAVAAERASLLDEIKRMVEQASASTEILNELILNKEQVGGWWQDAQHVGVGWQDFTASCA
jgi:hypothetical protein